MDQERIQKDFKSVFDLNMQWSFNEGKGRGPVYYDDETNMVLEIKYKQYQREHGGKSKQAQIDPLEKQIEIHPGIKVDFKDMNQVEENMDGEVIRQWGSVSRDDNGS